MIALVAVSTDAMLPALPDIGRELGAAKANDSQLVLSWFFIGLAVGGLFFGPVSDSTGRKPPIYLGLALFIAGCVMSIMAVNFQMILVARLLQGFGASGPRSVAVAVVRDRFAGREMARVMSFVMSVFILIPVVAPLFGQAILLFAGWRTIFVFLLIFAIVIAIWFGVRQPETLLKDQRTPFSAERILAGFREVLGNRTAFGFTLASGLISGAFLGYLNSAQPVFQDQYALGTRFPLVFAAISIASGLAFFLNARLVMRYGMRRLSHGANTSLAILSIAYFAYAYAMEGHPPLWTLIAYFMLNFFAVGIMFGNLNSLAMEPLGHVAGIGSAVVSSLSSFISIPIGAFIGRSFNFTMLPLVGGFAAMCFIAIFVMRWADSAEAKLKPAT